MKYFAILSLVLCVSSSGDATSLPSECKTKEGYIAAISEKYLDDAVSYSVDKDYEALQKLLDAGVIIVMKKDLTIHIVDTHIFSGSVEFRLKGSTQIFWTLIEAVKC